VQSAGCPSRPIHIQRMLSESNQESLKRRIRPVNTVYAITCAIQTSGHELRLPCTILSPEMRTSSMMACYVRVRWAVEITMGCSPPRLPSMGQDPFPS
jgi:hypothetical protein